MPKETVSNAELLEFIKDNVAMKSEMISKDNLKEYVSKNDLVQSENRVINAIEKLSTRVKRVIDEDYPAQKKRISRVEFRTEKFLGNKLATTDAHFEHKYRGEKELAEQETGA